MKLVKLMTIALAIITAAALGTAPTAFAVEPNLLPEGTEASPLSFEAEATKTSELKSEGKVVTCTTAPTKGEIGGKEFTPGRLGLVIIEFLGCESEKTECIGLEKGEATKHIKTHAIVHIWRGWLINAKGEEVLHDNVLVLLPLHVHFTCGFGLVLILVLGCVAGLLTPNKTLTKTAKLELKENEKKEGINDITKVENEKGEKIPCELKSARNEGAEAKALELATAEIKGFKQNGKEVEVLLMA
jgi:hypothetical protein